MHFAFAAAVSSSVGKSVSKSVRKAAMFHRGTLCMMLVASLAAAPFAYGAESAAATGAGASNAPAVSGAPGPSTAPLMPSATSSAPPTASTADDTFLLIAPVAFDASTIEVWVPLAHGARLVVYPPGPVEPHELGAALKAERVSVLFLTAQLLNLVVDTDPTLLSPVRLLITGGEAMSATHMRRLRDVLPNLAIINAYGPTEATTVATDYMLPELIPKGSVSIGSPIGDTRTFVLDVDMNLVPVGVAGELYIGGPGVARGYLRDPGLTSTRFVADPIGPPGERLYRTGDLVRWRVDDGLEFLGRTDDQIKLRGFRIEPGEIAAAVKGHPAVRDAFVLLRGHGSGAELVAYFAAMRELSDQLGDELRAYLRERLPGPMVPSQFIPVDKLPLSSSGKVDRAALPVPQKRSGGTGQVAPRTDAEVAVAAEWSALLEVQEVYADDNFFTLGGDSPTAARAVSRLAARFNVQLRLSSIFTHPTVRGMAAEISQLSSSLEIPTKWSESDWLCLGRYGSWPVANCPRLSRAACGDPASR